jgi:BirA family biotin operon repressor/biotin-[acetyl-CoA-carboxylase] ligase
VHVYSTIDSTNVRARELAEQGSPAGTLVVADEQKAGQGRRGRGWYSPKGGGLYLSLVLRPAELPNPGLISLLAGLGMARAVDRLLEGGPAAVKWPNDLIVADRKAGGALSEVSWAENRPAYVVLGIGINVHQTRSEFPPALRDVAISLDMAAGRAVSRLELADHVLDEVEGRCAAPPADLDADALRQLDDYDWLRDRRCATVPSPDAEPIAGVAVGIAPDGALLFRPDRGALQRVKGGHVVVESLPTPDY